MNEIRSIVLSILRSSIVDVYSLDSINLNDGVSEWNICARLAMYMEKRMRDYDFLYRTELFKDYYVDVEYNRSYGGNPKVVGGNKVRVDLIVHSREETKPNYLVLEMKKPKNPKKRIDDERELNRMVRPREKEAVDYYNCGSFVGVFMDYNKDSYCGKLFWYNELTKDVETKDFNRNNMSKFIVELFK